MGKKYPYAISNWENNWEDVSSFFQFSNDIRRIMYTTNIIEGLNRQYRKVTKTSVFPSDSALEKMLYLASENVVKKWTQREIPELGSGIESADSPLRRTAYCLSVREKKSRNGKLF